MLMMTPAMPRVKWALVSFNPRIISCQTGACSAELRREEEQICSSPFSSLFHTASPHTEDPLCEEIVCSSE